MHSSEILLGLFAVLFVGAAVSATVVHVRRHHPFATISVLMISLFGRPIGWGLALLLALRVDERAAWRGTMGLRHRNGVEGPRLAG